VGNAIDPGAKRASGVVEGEAAPHRKVDFLQQVAALLGIGFIGFGEPVECWAEMDCCVVVEAILGRYGIHGRLDFTHIKVVGED
jgi:hypothetical protein